jgi:hypothetical protein
MTLFGFLFTLAHSGEKGWNVLMFVDEESLYRGGVVVGWA